MEEYPVVSVVVTTKNEAKSIENCLRSIKKQTYPQKKIEIIIVDNNSTDKTKEIAKRFADKVYNKGPERSAQRNFGVERARGKYILYLDADMILSKDVISECVEKCLPRRKPTCPVASASAGWYGEAFLRGENEDCVALYIPERIVNLSSDQLNNRCNLNFNLRNQRFWIKVRDFERNFYNATVIDCVRFIQRDKFLKIGGFDEKLTGPEDWDFDRRIKEKGKVDIINAPLYHNEGEFNLKEYLKKKSYYSRFFNKYIQKWGKDDSIIRKQLGPWYRLFGVFIENRKWKRFISKPHLAFGIIILRCSVGLVFLVSKISKITRR